MIRCKTEAGEEKIVGTGVIDTLHKVDQAAHEVKEGNECGIKFVGDVALMEGDVLEAFKVEKKERVI